MQLIQGVTKLFDSRLTTQYGNIIGKRGTITVRQNENITTFFRKGSEIPVKYTIREVSNTSISRVSDNFESGIKIIKEQQKNINGKKTFTYFSKESNDKKVFVTDCIYFDEHEKLSGRYQSKKHKDGSIWAKEQYKSYAFDITKYYKENKPIMCIKNVADSPHHTAQHYVETKANGLLR